MDEARGQNHESRAIGLSLGVTVGAVVAWVVGWGLMLSAARWWSPEPGVTAEQAALLASAAGGSVNGQEIYETTCVVCHGPDAMGMQELGSPALRGQEDWYAIAQIEKFNNDIRGAHEDDVFGKQMKPIVSQLTAEQIAAVSKYVSELEPRLPEATLEGGDPEKGKAAYAVCTACHAVDAAGMQTVNSPSLRGLNDWYMLTQLKNFNEGIRGTHPEDITGMQMRPMALTLTDEQAMIDVIAYIRQVVETGAGEDAEGGGE